MTNMDPANQSQRGEPVQNYKRPACPDPNELAKYPDHWVAADVTDGRIVWTGKNLDDLVEMLKKSGLDPASLSVRFVVPPDVSICGGRYCISDDENTAKLPPIVP